MLDAPTFFEVLGVGRTVLAAEAKKACLKISRDVHPDKNKHLARGRRRVEAQ